MPCLLAPAAAASSAVVNLVCGFGPFSVWDHFRFGAVFRAFSWHETKTKRNETNRPTKRPENFRPKVARKLSFFGPFSGHFRRNPVLRVRDRHARLVDRSGAPSGRWSPASRGRSAAVVLQAVSV